MDTKLKQAILGLGAAGFALGVSGTAWSDHVDLDLLDPQEFELVGGGDPGCQEAIDAINAVPGNQFPISPRPNITDGFIELVITNPPTSSGVFEPFTTDDTYFGMFPDNIPFAVGLDVAGGKNKFFIREETEVASDESALKGSQIRDIPGFEVAMFQRGNITKVFYQINQNDSEYVYIAPGNQSQTPNKVVICWAVGPSGMRSQEDIKDTCDNFNKTYDTSTTVCVGTLESCLRTADGFQAKMEPGFGSVVPFNVSACAPRVARWCDQSLPAGEGPEPGDHVIPNSCNPTGTSFGGTTSSVDAAGGSIVSSFEGMFTNF